MGSALKYCKFEEGDVELAQVICDLLVFKKTTARPKDIANSVVQLLKFEPILMTLISENRICENKPKYEELLGKLGEIDLLLKFMAICAISDIQIERVPREARRHILMTAGSAKPKNLIKVQIALALQCFTNEFNYYYSPKEETTLKKLINKIGRLISCGEAPSVRDVLCVASYKPLYTFDWASELPNNATMNSVLKRQVVEPTVEKNIRKTIVSDHLMKNKISLQVKGQYEQNPYPRWVIAKLPPVADNIAGLVKATKMKLVEPLILKTQKPTILVVGCGTSQHSIATAS